MKADRQSTEALGKESWRVREGKVTLESEFGWFLTLARSRVQKVILNWGRYPNTLRKGGTRKAATTHKQEGWDVGDGIQAGASTTRINFFAGFSPDIAFAP